MEPRRTPPVASTAAAADAPPAAALAGSSVQAARFALLLQPATTLRSGKTVIPVAEATPPNAPNQPAAEPKQKAPSPAEESADEKHLQSLAGAVAAATVQVLLLDVPQVEEPLLAAATGETFADAGMPPGQAFLLVTSGAGDAVRILSAPAGAEPSKVDLSASDAAKPNSPDQSRLSVFDTEPVGAIATLARAVQADSSIPSSSEQQHAETRAQPRNVDAARLLKRVVRALTAAEQRDGQIHLRLSPPELGSLRLELQVKGDALVARVQAETAAAQAVLLDSLPLLRERLAEQGLRIERFDVELMQHEAGDQPNASPDREHPPPPVPRTPAKAGAAEEPNKSRGPFPRRQPGRLNVII
jgi:flagellar hook-length control protein FliK